MTECGVSYLGVRRLKLFQQDLEDMASHGISFVVHTMSENDWSLYYETLRGMLRATHTAGMQTWLDPLALGYVFGDNGESQFVPTHPEACQVDQDGRLLPGACLNQPAFRKFVSDWVGAALALEPDMLFWDEPHSYIGDWHGQPGRWGCRCSLCQSLYRERFGEKMPLRAEDPGVQAFKAESLRSFLGEILGHSKKQGGRNAITLLPAEYQENIPPDWEGIASLPGVDNLGTDPYPFPAYSNQPSYADRWQAFVTENVQRILALGREHGLDSHLWIQGFSVPAQDQGYLEQAIDLAAGAGITHLAVWGFDGDRDMSAFACEQPDQAWELIGQGFRRVRGK